MHPSLRYLLGYPLPIIEQVSPLVESRKLIPWFEQRYPHRHSIKSEKALFDYALEIKNQFMKKTVPVRKVVYDSKTHLIHNALGLHSVISRNQGGKLKSNNEIRISSIFKDAPEPLLRIDLYLL